MHALFEHLGVDYVQWQALTIAALKLDFRLSAVGRSQFRRNVGTIAGLVGQHDELIGVGSVEHGMSHPLVERRPEPSDEKRQKQGLPRDELTTDRAKHRSGIPVRGA